MTGPAVSVTQAPAAKILSGDEWEQAQYAPHRVANDPTKPQGVGRILTGDEWEQANRAGSVRSLRFQALPKIAPIQAEATAAPTGKAAKAGKELAPFDIADPTTYANPILRQLVNPMLEHPLASLATLAAPVVVPPAAGLAIGAGMVGSTIYHIASYGWQKAAEVTLSPEDRAQAEADPDRISGESAAVQAMLLGLAPLIHAGVKRLRTPVKVPDGATVPVVEPDLATSRALDAERVTQGATPQPYFETPQGADVLGRTAARHGLPEEASPYPPGTPNDIAWKNGHTTTTALAGEGTPKSPEWASPETITAAAIRLPDNTVVTGRHHLEALEKARFPEGLTDEAQGFVTSRGRFVDRTEADKIGRESGQIPQEVEPFEEGASTGDFTKATEIKPGDQRRGFADVSVPALESPVALAEIPAAERVALPRNVGQKNLYRRLSDEALKAEYRVLMDKQATEQEAAIAPIWTEERNDAWVAAAENKRRGDWRQQGLKRETIGNRDSNRTEMLGQPLHTFESQAAEQRVNARAKHIDALEQELTGRGIAPMDVFTPAEEPAGGLTPVAGTGETKTRGLAVGVETKAVENKLTDYLGDLPEYRSINMADQAARAGRFLTEDAALARRVALGEAPAPADLLPESVFVAVENKAIAEGDVGTLRELAAGKLTEQATTMGQRIRALGERDPESPVAAMQRIVEARTKGVTDPEGAVAKTLDELRTHIADATQIEPGAFTKFIDDLRCS